MNEAEVTCQNSVQFTHYKALRKGWPFLSRYSWKTGEGDTLSPSANKSAKKLMLMCSLHGFKVYFPESVYCNTYWWWGRVERLRGALLP